MTEHPPPPPQKWYLRWWSVFVWLLTLGPFGFPLLWKSKDFNLFWKWFWTLAITAFTVWLTWGVWKAFQAVLELWKSTGVL